MSVLPHSPVLAYSIPVPPVAGLPQASSTGGDPVQYSPSTPPASPAPPTPLLPVPAVPVVPAEVAPPPTPPGFCLELFCGSANLSQQLAMVGFRALGVDNSIQEQARGRVCRIDLSSASGRQSLIAMLGHPFLRYVHMGPPCGTASRAREKRIPARLRRSGFPPRVCNDCAGAACRFILNARA